MLRPSGVLAALQNGEIDAVTGTGGLTVNNAPDLDKIEGAGLYDVLYEPGYQWEHIDINTAKEGSPLADQKVRQALYYAIDKQALVDKLYFGKQGTTDLPVPPGLSWAYTDTYNKYPYDPEKAAALLAEAGWDCSALPCVNADGKTLEFTLIHHRSRRSPGPGPGYPADVEEAEYRRQPAVPVRPWSIRHQGSWRPAQQRHLRHRHLHLDHRR